jgi:hypothetical protein
MERQDDKGGCCVSRVIHVHVTRTGKSVARELRRLCGGEMKMAHAPSNVSWDGMRVGYGWQAFVAWCWRVWR